MNYEKCGLKVYNTVKFRTVCVEIFQTTQCFNPDDYIPGIEEAIRDG
jgi:hypothetical protein